MESTDPVSLSHEEGTQGDEHQGSTDPCDHHHPGQSLPSSQMGTASVQTQWDSTHAGARPGAWSTHVCAFWNLQTSSHLSGLLSNREKTSDSTFCEQRLRNSPRKAQATVSLGTHTQGRGTAGLAGGAQPPAECVISAHWGAPPSRGCLRAALGTGLRSLLRSLCAAGGERHPGARLDLCSGEALCSLHTQHSAP